MVRKIPPSPFTRGSEEVFPLQGGSKGVLKGSKKVALFTRRRA